MAGSRTMGTKLSLTSAGGTLELEVPLDIKSLTTIGEIGGEREEIDVTTLDSPNGAKEYIAGAVDWSTQDIEGNITEDNKEQIEKLRSVFDAQAVGKWKIETPAKNTIEYDAFISAFKYGEKTTDGLDTFSMTLRITGDVTFKKAENEQE